MQQSAAADVAAVDMTWVRGNYTKYEYMVPMRDGTRLLTRAFVPKDERQSYPILLTRTPYGMRPYGVDNYPRDASGLMQHYAREMFIFVTQDVRGRNGSEGDFEHIRPHNVALHVAGSPVAPGIDESTDTWDSIEWLVNNVPLNNTNVCLTGISYAGFYSVHGLLDAHPACKCISPQAPMVDWFIGDDFHHNGVFYLASGFGFLMMFGQQLKRPTREFPRPFDYETPDGYEFYLNLGPLKNIPARHLGEDVGYWAELSTHGSYDEYWQARTPLPHITAGAPAVLTVGGWFDAEDLYGPLSLQRRLVECGAPDAHLVMGPWSHGGWHRGDGDCLGAVRFHQNTSAWYRREVELPWLNHHLKDGPAPDLAAATVFETGTNQWRRYTTWPPEKSAPCTLYLGEKGVLQFEPPGDGAVQAFDEWVSDPAKPVPFIPNIAMGMTREHMVDDQRFAASRPDVVVYVTPPLEEDLTVAGPLRANLWVSTSGTDSDWVVKLIDVYHGDYPNPEPNPLNLRMGGYQQLVRGEAFRGKFRKGLDDPQPFTPGVPELVGWDMPDIYHTFRRGHRLMVQVQSSWFPLVDRNPQTFCDIYNCDEAAFQRATQRVYRAGDKSSTIELQVLNRPHR